MSKYVGLLDCVMWLVTLLSKRVYFEDPWVVVAPVFPNLACPVPTPNPMLCDRCIGSPLIRPGENQSLFVLVPIPLALNRPE